MLIGDETTQPARSIAPLPYPDNDREFIIDVLVGTHRYNTDHWTCTGGEGVVDLARANGYTPLATWRATQPGATVTMRGRIDADLTGIAKLRIRAMAGIDQHITLRACVDGQWVDVGGPTQGVDDYTEVDGPVSGSRLSAVDVICNADRPGTMTNGMMWAMAVLPGEPTPWPQPDPAWPDMLRERDLDFTPTVGLLGDGDALAAWREQLRDPALTALWRKQVETAEAALALSPESFANPITPYSKQRFGRPDVPDKPPHSEALALATVGLVEQRPEMLRHAARFALTMSRCKRWVQYGLEAIDGIEYTHGRFAQSAAARMMSLLLDRAGCALTDAGLAYVASAIRHMGVLDIDPIMRPGSYVWNMNQGIVFEAGRLLGAIATDRWFPGELPRRIELAKAMLTSVLTKAFSDDGGAEEGTSYWHYTLGTVPEMTSQLARLCGGNPADYIPPNVAASAKWALTNLRTDSDVPLMLTYGDSKYDRPISGHLAAFFAGPLGIEGYRPIARHAYPAAIEPTYLAHAKQALEQDGDSDPTAAPTLTVFPVIEQVDVKQPDPRDGMRIYFLSGKRAGHGHDDRNSFILEAFGKPILIDRATPAYTHPATAVCKTTQAHNGIAPDGHTQMADVREPSATLTDVREEGDRVIIESDASAAWRDWSVRVVRRLTHLRPDVLVVEDIAQWNRPTVTWQYWHSLSPWEQTSDDTWHTNNDGVEMSLRAIGNTTLEMAAEVYSVDGSLRPVHRLCVNTPRGDGADLVTLIQVRRSSDNAWPIDAASLSHDAATVTMHRGDGSTVDINRIAPAD